MFSVLRTARSARSHFSRRRWSKACLGLEALESRTLLSSAPVVAVLDTGVDTTNPLILSHLYQNPSPFTIAPTDFPGLVNDIYGWNFVSNTNQSTVDPDGHGTAMATAVINAAQSAVANSNVQILPVVTMVGMSPPGGTGGAVQNFVASTPTPGKILLTETFTDGSTWSWYGDASPTNPLLPLLNDTSGSWTWSAPGPWDTKEGSPTPSPATTPLSVGNSGWTFAGGLATYVSVAPPTAPVLFGSLWTTTNGTWGWAGPDPGLGTLASPFTDALGTWTYTTTGPFNFTPSPLSTTFPQSGPGTGTWIWDPIAKAWTVKNAPTTVGAAGTGIGNAMGTPTNSDKELLEGIDYVLLLKRVEGVNIVAMTISQGGWYSTQPNTDPFLAPIQNAIQQAENAGIIVVMGAGNGANNNDVLPSFPADYSLGQVVVSATNGSALWNSSNYGGGSVLLAAPSTAGTEFAAAEVAGAAAGLAQIYNNPSSSAIVHALTISVDTLPSLSGKVITGGVLDIPNAINYFNNVAPRGWVDSASNTQISGWALDTNNLALPVSLQLYVDGAAVTTVVANQTRADLGPVFGSINHGFTVNLTANVGFGTHTVDLYMLDLPTDTLKLLYQGVVSRPRPTGYLDLASFTDVVGWAYAPGFNSSTVVNTEVFVDGSLYQSAPANLFRGTLTAVIGSPYHGFNIPLTLTGTKHTLDIYGLDPASGQLALMFHRVITNALPVGYVDVANATHVAGWVIDPDSPTALASFRIDIDGVAGTPMAASNSHPGLVQQFGSAMHGFDFALPTLTAGFHRVDVNFVDAQTGQVSLIKSIEVNTNVPPTGWVDVLNSTHVAGWAFDADSGATSIQVRVEIDGVPQAPVTASIARANLTAIPSIGSPNHGFDIALPALPVGVHNIRVEAIDPVNSNLVLLGSGTISSTDTLAHRLPIGRVDALTATGVAGWAFDANTGAGAVNVRVDVDGVTVLGPTAANITRNDLLNVVGSANHGYNLTFGTPLVGQHLVNVYYIDPTSGNADLIKSQLLLSGGPLGFVDSSPTASSAAPFVGWALSQDDSSVPIDVRLDIDGSAGFLTQADLSRPDLLTSLVPAPANALHGFSIATINGNSGSPVLSSVLSNGKHVLTLIAINPVTLNYVTIGQITITV